MQKIRPAALLLDMDGLLVDSEPLWFKVEQAFCHARGFDWTQEDAYACIGRGLAATVMAMANRFGFDVELERDVAALIDSFMARTDQLSFKYGASKLLDTAFGAVPLALASSSPTRLIQAVVQRFELQTKLKVIVSGDDVEKPKPAPNIFLKAAQLLGVPPAECVVLEDSLAGVMAGRAGNMRVIAVPEKASEFSNFAPFADVCVANLVEALEWLEIGMDEDGRAS